MFCCVEILLRIFTCCLCLTHPTGLSKYSTTHKYTQRYYTTKYLIRYIYCILTCNSFRQLLVRSWRSWCGIQSDFLSFYLVGVCFCSDRLQNGISDDEAMLTNFVVCMQCYLPGVNNILYFKLPVQTWTINTTQ